HAPNEMLRLQHFEGRAFGFEREGMDATVGAAAAEIHEEEMAIKTIRQTGSGKIRHAGRTGGDVRDWRDDVGCLALKMRIPKFLRIERPARIRPFHELIADPPAIVAAFNQVNPAGLVAT